MKHLLGKSSFILSLACFCGCTLISADSQNLSIEEQSERYRVENEWFEEVIEQVNSARNRHLDEAIEAIHMARNSADVSRLNQYRLYAEEAVLIMEAYGNADVIPVLSTIEPVHVDKGKNPLLYAKSKQLEALSIYLENTRKAYLRTTEIYEEILPIFQQHGVVREVVTISVFLSTDYTMWHRFDKCKTVLWDARKFAVRKGKNESAAIIDTHLGYWMFEPDSLNLEILNNLNAACELFRKTNNNYQLLMANMSLIYNGTSSNKEESLKQFDENMELAKRLNCRTTLCSLIRLKATYFSQQNDFKEAIHLANQAMELAKELNSEGIMFWLSTDLVGYLVKSENPAYAQQAYLLIDEVLEKGKLNGDKTRVSFVRLEYAKLLYREAKYDEAIEQLDTIIPYFDEMGYTLASSWALLLKSDVYSAKQNFEGAFRAIKQVLEKKIASSKESYQKQLAEAHKSLDNTIRENQLKLTEAQLELDKLKIARQELRNRALTAFLILTLVSLLGLVFFFIRTRRARHQLVELTSALTNKTQSLELEKQKHVEANAALQSSILRMKEIDEERKAILGIAAHDLKNPLAAIENTTEMIATEMQDLKVPEGHAVHRLIRMTRESSTFLNQLIEKILHARKAESRLEHLDLRWINPTAIVEQTIAINQNNARAKGMELRIQNRDCGEVHCDPQGLREALDNLISNAIKYSYLNTKIDVGVRAGNTQTVIYVKDGGPGLKEKDFKRLFKPFSKLSARPTGNESSTGLGLSLVHQVVHAMGGSVDAINHPDGGAEFSIVLEKR